MPTFRVADAGDRAAAQRLLNAQFAAGGFGSDHPIPEDGLTLVALEAGEVIATVTLVVDEQGAWLVRLASAARRRRSEVLAGLFRLAYDVGQGCGAEWLYAECRPRHAQAYVDALGFEKVGEETYRAEVNSMSQLLRKRVSAIAQAIAAPPRGTLYDQIAA